jgi:hypothetical protein
VSITISSTIVEKIRDVWRAPLKFRVTFKSVELAENAQERIEPPPFRILSCCQAVVGQNSAMNLKVKLRLISSFQWHAFDSHVATPRIAD